MEFLWDARVWVRCRSYTSQLAAYGHACNLRCCRQKFHKFLIISVTLQYASPWLLKCYREPEAAQLKWFFHKDLAFAGTVCPQMLQMLLIVLEKESEAQLCNAVSATEIKFNIREVIFSPSCVDCREDTFEVFCCFLFYFEYLLWIHRSPASERLISKYWFSFPRGSPRRLTTSAISAKYWNYGRNSECNQCCPGWSPLFVLILWWCPPILHQLCKNTDV